MPKAPFWLNLDTLAAAIIAALLIYIGVQKIELLTCRLHSKDFQSQLEKISDTKNTQKQVTERTVKEVIQGQERVRTVVKTIHDAPNPPDCKTPGIEQLRGAV